MPYRLKGEAFEVVDGPCAGLIYKRGVVYDEIPPGEDGKFDEIKETTMKSASGAKTAPAEGVKKTGIEVPPGETGEVKS